MEYFRKAINSTESRKRKADDLNNQQTRDGDAVDDNIGSTPAANVTAANLYTAAFDEVPKMFSTFEKKSEEWDKGKTSGQTPDEITPAPTRKNPGDLPPIVEDEEEGEIEHVDVDSSSQF
ncbi:hypothetical protein F2Q70_00038873 [Brassica cretica]|uniref:Uncharacterized protein n=1 Tax=Brassica cretica TaxID=69181 RepID=A0A8S9KEI4_BRACR|nr:hypothetical protein F2Q70_00038873 [Brassica cretica]